MNKKVKKSGFRHSSSRKIHHSPGKTIPRKDRMIVGGRYRFNNPENLRETGDN
jgi:hypothetical protein